MTTEFEEYRSVKEIKKAIELGKDFWFKLAFFKSNRNLQIKHLEKYAEENKLILRKTNNRFIYCKVKKRDNNGKN